MSEKLTFPEHLETGIMKTIIQTMQELNGKGFNVRVLAKKITAEVLTIFEQAELALQETHQTANVG